MSSMASPLACGIKLAMPVPLVGGKLKSMCALRGREEWKNDVMKMYVHAFKCVSMCALRGAGGMENYGAFDCKDTR